MVWPIKTIGDTCELMTGGTPSKSKPEYFEGGNIKWLVSGDIHQKVINDCEGRITEAGLENSSAKYLPENSVLIALNGQGKTRGSVALLRTKATCNQSLVCIDPKDKSELLPEFLYSFLYGNYENIREMTGDGGNDRRGLNMPLIRSIEIPLPPISEQKRIVAILDQAFADIDKARALTEQNLKNARELFESYLQQVFSQRGIGWEEEVLSNVCEVKDGTHDSPKYVESGIPFVTQKNIRVDGLSFDDTKFISEADHENFYRRSDVSCGDILISMIGANRGMACLVDDKRTFSIKNVGLIKKSVEIDMSFLLYYLKSSLARAYVESESKGGAQPFIGLTKLRAFPVYYPQLKKQKEYVEKLSSIESQVSLLTNIYLEKHKLLEELKKSLLQKTFSGELTKDNQEAA